MNESGWPKIEVKGKDGKRRQVRWHQEFCDHHNRLIQSSLAVGGTIVLADPYKAKQMVVDGKAFPYGSEADQCDQWTHKNKPTLDIEKLARERERLHIDHPSSRPLSNDYELVGLAGEQAFSVFSGLPVDISVKPSGDNGIDFILPGGKTVDVKMARKAYNLLHEANKPLRADIYVLARYNDETKSATLLGWIEKSVLENAPVKDFGYGIENRYVSANVLHKMDTLLIK